MGADGAICAGRVGNSMGQDYCIISDSSCDLPQELADRYQVKIVPFYVSFDGVNYRKERTQIGVRTFYQEMVDHRGVFPKSSLPSVQDYVEAFEPEVRAGRDIVCICITAKFSGSVQSACNARNLLLETYPEARIEVIDSRVNTVLQGLYTLEAARMREAGIPMEDCVRELLALRESGRIFFSIGSIDYLKHGGRIGKLSGLAASVLGIKPIITLKEGEIFNSGLSRSRKGALVKVIALLKEHIAENQIDLKEYRLCVGYGYDYAEAYEFRKQLLDALDGQVTEAECRLYQIGATIGVHTGPYPLGIGLLRRQRLAADVER